MFICIATSVIATNKMASDLLAFQNPVFAFYTLCSAILLIKTISMSILTGFTRIAHKSFPYPEDNVHAGLKPDEVKPPHPNVERVRRCHQNDLENNIPFVLIGLLYTLTNPSVFTARLFFGVFTISRLVHSVIFLNGVRQPFRFLTFLVGLTVNYLMLICVIVHVLRLS